MKKTFFVVVILLLTMNTSQAQKIKCEGITLNNNKVTLKTNIGGHKVQIKSPSLSKSKYLKLVRIAL